MIEGIINEGTTQNTGESKPNNQEQHEIIYTRGKRILRQRKSRIKRF